MSLLDKFPTEDETLENAKDIKDSLYDYEDNPKAWVEILITLAGLALMVAVYLYFR